MFKNGNYNSIQVKKNYRKQTDEYNESRYSRNLIIYLNDIQISEKKLFRQCIYESYFYNLGPKALPLGNKGASCSEILNNHREM